MVIPWMMRISSAATSYEQQHRAVASSPSAAVSDRSRAVAPAEQVRAHRTSGRRPRSQPSTRDLREASDRHGGLLQQQQRQRQAKTQATSPLICHYCQQTARYTAPTELAAALADRRRSFKRDAVVVVAIVNAMSYRPRRRHLIRLQRLSQTFFICKHDQS